VTEKPLLLVDVDGVISLFGFDHANRPAGAFEMVDGIAHYLSATAGENLRTLATTFDLVWCTGWEEKANEYLPRALGLPGPLPYLSFDQAIGRANTHWKLDAIDARRGPTLLGHTDAPVGVTADPVDELLAWARAGQSSASSRSRTTPGASSGRK
jgi:hypothetical protein